MDLFRWILGAVLIAFAFYVMALAIIRQVANYKKSKKENGNWSSPTPIIGSFTFLLGYALIPMKFSYWSLLIIVVDIETLMVIIGLPYALLSQRTNDDS